MTSVQCTGLPAFFDGFFKTGRLKGVTMTKETIQKEHRILQLKYAVLAMVVGICVGIVDTIFGRGLLAISAFRTAHWRCLLPFLPLAGLLIVWMYHHFSTLSLKGMSLIFETGQKKRDQIPLALVPLVILGTWITHLFGGSAGREGVAVQIGATLSHEAGRRLHIRENKPVMLITGMAAGFGGLFQTPLAAVFFAMEVIVAGYLEYDALLPALIAAYTASFTSHFLGLEKFAVDIQDTWTVTDLRSMISLIALGLAFGLAGRCFSVLLQKAKKLFGEKISNPLIRIGVMAIPLAALLFVIHGGRYTGLGTNLIGASLGVVLGSILGIPPMICGALGYAAVFGSATNTLIAPILIGLEVFGTRNTLPLILVCILAYLINGNHSIYGAQQKALCRFEK